MINTIKLLLILIIVSSGFSPAFALTELQRATISDPRLETAFGAAIGDHVNAKTQFQISVDVTNNQEISQDFYYIVQIKNNEGLVEKIGWVSGNLSPYQKWTASLSWIPQTSGAYIAEIFAWEALVNHHALTEYKEYQIIVS